MRIVIKFMSEFSLVMLYLFDYSRVSFLLILILFFYFSGFLFFFFRMSNSPLRMQKCELTKSSVEHGLVIGCGFNHYSWPFWHSRTLQFLSILTLNAVVHL